MKLSKKDKQELRKSVEVLLNASPDNKKIQLSNETLDQLLFDTYVVNKEKGIKVKLPVWSGDFLRKLDLSRVSFEDVSWGMMSDETIIDYFDYSIIDEDFKDKLDEGHIGFGSICYANTNAKIDLSKSFDAKYGNKFIQIVGCDFSNTDLSNTKLQLNGKSFKIISSNCSNTNIPLCFFITPDSDLSNNDFNKLDIDANELLHYDDWAFYGTNLTNTGAHINLNINNDLTEKVKKRLKYYIENYWIGCYLNGKLLKSPDEKKHSAEATRGEYEQYKSQEFANILGSIAEQMDSSGPKK